MRVAIIGAGGFGREAADLARAVGLEVAGFIDNAPADEVAAGLHLLGGDAEIGTLRGRGTADAAVVAIGDGRIRERLLGICRAAGLALPVLVHPTATVMTRIPVGEGSILYPGVVVMTDCVIGRGVLLNCGATLGHDARIADCSNINPGAHVAGRVIIGSRTTVGIGAAIRENLTIGSDVIIGAGSVVVDHLPDGIVAYGVPARARGAR
jgi:sugar O-acyltransferase (sialic acid O-acetyltransferase NeuD family)